MKTNGGWSCGIAAAAFAAFAAAMPGRLDAEHTTAQAIQIGDSDLGGVVTSANGPEAGVWVIAETTDLATKFAKIVVTDDRGRYRIPDLPKANYGVWVRGAMYDPKTGKFTLIDLCFSTHHLEFARDPNDTLWFSSGVASDVLGWLDTKMLDATGDEQKSQGWTAFVLDTNGNGKRDDYVEPSQAVDPTKDKRIVAGLYGIAPSPVDGSIWGSVLGFPGAIVRVTPGPNPPATALTEIYEPPVDDPGVPVHGYSPRGMDIDSNGVAWVSLASGHLASFDRRKCKGPLNGPTATGKHCPEGWTLYPYPGPQFKGVTDSGSAEASYFTWVDQFNTFGLGANVPISTGNGNDALLALVDGKFVVLRVPYPMGFYAKGMDGRIDDPNDGWKGRGLWSTYGTRTPFHVEGGKGTTSKVVYFQLRPDPLAR